MGRSVTGPAARAMILFAVGSMLTLSACQSSSATAMPPSASTNPSSTNAPSDSSAPSADTSPTGPGSPTPSASPKPTATAFWKAVAARVAAAGHLRIRVVGSSPGILRYLPDASATVEDGRVVFICVDGRAYDGQSGDFAIVPGAWSCGADALVGGFRHNGQPLDAWSTSLPGDDRVSEKVTIEPDGRWRWDYSARSAVFGGTVRTSVWIDPTTGQLLDARRSDPTGDTRYGISYAETFPAIVAP